MNYEKYNQVIKAIRRSNYLMDSYEKNYLINYMNSIRDNKRNNDFFEWDFLFAIMLEFANGEIDIQRGEETLEGALNRAIKDTKKLLPAGSKTDNYEIIKNIIIVGSFNVDYELFTSFNNKINYQQIVNLINEDKEHGELIKKFALRIASYFPSEIQFKKEIVSFCKGLKDYYGDNVNDFYEDRVREVQKRFGVYDLDEKKLAILSLKQERIDKAQDKLDDSLQRVDTFEEKVKTISDMYIKNIEEITARKIKEINASSTKASKKLEKSLDLVKEELIEQLNSYMLILQSSMKQSCDEVFKKVLEEASAKLNGIKVLAEGLSTTTTQNLLNLQKTTEESMGKLKSYVNDDPELKKAIEEASKSEKIREAILAYDKENTSKKSTNEVVLAGYDRIIVPSAPNVIIPKGKISRKLIRAFDESVPFDVRLKEVLERKRIKESQGEIFHKLTEQVLICIMEGDWPYLYGPSGCGKSYLIKQVAELLGIDLVENGKITEKESIMGYNDVYGRYRASQAFVASAYGKLLSLDEFDNNVTEHQIVLNPIYSALLDTIDNPDKKKYITFGEDMAVAIHPNFRMIAAGNTNGSGADYQYSDRGKIDESVQERLTPIKYFYDNKVEKTIFGPYKAWYTLFTLFRDACQEYARTEDESETPPGMITTRDAQAITRYIKHNSKSVESIIDEKFTQTKDLDYLRKIRDYVQNKYSISSDETKKIQVPGKLDSIKDEKVLARCLIHGCTTRINQMVRKDEKY